MRSLKILSHAYAPILAIGISATLPAFADYQGPIQADPRANSEIYSLYCTGNPDSTEIPAVNYANQKVQEAAKRLSAVAAGSFYFYGPIKKAYQLVNKDGTYVTPPASAPAGTTPDANAFLVQLCGEFRDRASMIEAKLTWTTKLNKLPAKKQQAFEPSKSPWLQMTAASYPTYLVFSRSLFDAKQALTHSSPYTIAGENVDQPVNGTTVCETKYIFSNFIAKGIAFSGLDKFNAGLEPFAQANCSLDDRIDYYDFRGDSNFKPNSPESNGMIWYAKTIASQCDTPSTAKAGAKITNDDCQRYFRSPFKNRWNAARAGLAAWLWRDRSLDQYFSQTSSLVTIIPHLEATTRPFDFVADTVQSKFDPAFAPSDFQGADLGLNRITQGNVDLLYRLLRDSVNRHTDWYASGYKDGVGIDVTQAYSPFVASSYEMSASNGFTQPGVTVAAPGDGRKHWMFVFRIKGANWYNSKSAKNGQPVDFDTNWLDETSLGNNGLADSEHAWDRLGTALEGDLDSILYLHNVTTSETMADDGLPQLEFPGGPYASPAATPATVTPPAVTPPVITPPTVKPPVVTPPAVTPPVITPPAVKPPTVTPPPANTGTTAVKATSYELKLDRSSFVPYDKTEPLQNFYRGKVHRRLLDGGVANEASAEDTKIRVEYVKVPVTCPNGESLSQVLAALAKAGIKPYP